MQAACKDGIGRRIIWLLLFLFAVTAWGQSRVIFQIGRKNHSVAELDQHWPKGRPVHYVVGRSRPATGWPAYQPGTFSPFQKYATTANYPRPEPPVTYQVQFQLRRRPAGAYELRLDLIFLQSHPVVPRLEIGLNQRQGIFRLHPRPDLGVWWRNGGLQPIFCGYEKLRLVFPARDLRRGQNHLRITPVDGFGLYYDDLGLWHTRKTPPIGIISARIIPTILFRRMRGELYEIARVILRHNATIAPSRIAIQVGTRSYLLHVAAHAGFGDAEFTLRIPAPQKAIPWHLRVAGRQYQGRFFPARHWRIYAMPMEQADWGYDEVPARVETWENRYIDRALQIARKYPGFKYELDGGGMLRAYLRNRTQVQRDQLLAYLRTDRFGVSPWYTSFFSGLPSAEELFQTLAYTQKLAARDRFSAAAALQTDLASFSSALPAIMADSGIKYFAAGMDPIRGSLMPLGLWTYHSPFYWQGQRHGGRVLTWLAMRHSQLHALTLDGWNPQDARTGRYTPSLFGLRKQLPRFLSNFSGAGYRYNAVLVYGSQHDEVPIRHWDMADIVARWDSKYAFPKIVMATEQDFFHYMVSHYGGQFPTVTGDPGVGWEDEAAADARTLARNRGNQMRAADAEKTASWIATLRPKVRFPREDFRRAWRNIVLTDDSIWGDEQQVLRPHSRRSIMGKAVHEGYAASAWRETHNLLLTSEDQIADLIADYAPARVVFNDNSWTRGGLVHLQMRPGHILENAITHHPLPCVSVGQLDGYNQVRCWVKSVPGMGYLTLVVVPGRMFTVRPHPIAAGSWVRGRYYAIQLDPRTGAIRHLIDRRSGRELVNRNSPYGLNQYLYVTGGAAPGTYGGPTCCTQLLSSDALLPLAQLRIHLSRRRGGLKVADYPWGVALTVTGRDDNTPSIESTITLFNVKKLISITDRVKKTQTRDKEGVYFAFPFKMQAPQAEFANAVAWVNPRQGLWRGANRQWFASQGAVRLRTRNLAVGLTMRDAPLITFGNIVRGLWPGTVAMNGTVFSYVMDNYWYTDTLGSQGGCFRFRYWLTSSRRLSHAALSRMEWDQRSPLHVIRRYHKEWKRFLPLQMRWITARPRSIALLNVLPGAKTHLWLLRLENFSGHAVTAQLHLPQSLALRAAYRASPIGQYRGPVGWHHHGIRMPLRPYAIATLAVRVDSSDRK